jgi:uncharacterized integral membrane protein
VDERGHTVWIFRGILFALLLVVLVWFFVDNSNQSVDIKFFSKSFLGISIYWVVVISFLVGFTTSFILAIIREFRLRGELNRLKRQGAGKDREIADLRTLPLRQTGSEDTNHPDSGVIRGE